MKILQKLLYLCPNFMESSLHKNIIYGIGKIWQKEEK